MQRKKSQSRDGVLRGGRGRVVALVVLLAGCADGGSGADGRGGLAAAGADTCAFTEVATSSADALFSEVTSVDVDSRGRIYVGDRGRADVTVLDEDGAVLRTLGGAGKGPGEFQWINDVQVLPGDSLLVYDYGLGRITVFAPASDSVAYTIDLGAASPLLPPNSVRRLPGTDAYVGRVLEPFRASGDDPSRDYERTQVVRLLNPDGSVQRDSVLVLRSGQSILTARNGRSVAAMPNRFGRPGELRAGPAGRLYYGWGDSLAVEIYSVDGRRVGGFTSPHRPPPVTDRDIERSFASETDARTFRSAAERFVERYASGRWPAFRTFRVDDRGRLWFGLLTLEGEPTEWAAYDTSGTRLCTTTLPENVTLERIGAERAFGVATDRDDVPRVVVYRMEDTGA